MAWEPPPWGVKLDDATRERIKSAATRIDRTPHWLIKQAIFLILNNWKTAILFRSYLRCFLARPMRAMKHRLRQRNHTSLSSDFAEQILPQSVSRAAITAAYRRPETEAVSMLLEQARLPQPVAEQAHKLAYQLVPINCVIKKNASGRAGMVRGYCRSFRCHRRKAWR